MGLCVRCVTSGMGCKPKWNSSVPARAGGWRPATTGPPTVGWRLAWRSTVGDVPYWWDGCGQPATHERLVGITSSGHEVTELVCADHATSPDMTIPEDPS